MPFFLNSRFTNPYLTASSGSDPLPPLRLKACFLKFFTTKGNKCQEKSAKKNSGLLLTVFLARKGKALRADLWLPALLAIVSLEAFYSPFCLGDPLVLDAPICWVRRMVCPASNIPVKKLIN